MMMALRVVLLALFIAAPVGGKSFRADLERLAADYAADPALLQPVTFGVRVDDEAWTVSARPAADGKPAEVTVSAGEPDVPAFVYVTDSATFARIASGDLHALTAMAQARASDPTPMRVETVNGFEMDAAGRNAFLSVSFHFFTTGQPEIVSFGPEHARLVHGGEAVPIYYSERLRTAWYGIAPGQHINAEPGDQVNDFDSLVVVIKGGSARARLGGQEVPLADNQAILVPAGMTHEFWNPGDERAAFLLIMFGETA